MKLDMDAYRAAMELPALVVDGTEYRAARLLTFNEVVRLQKQFQDAAGSGEAVLAVATELCDLSGIPASVVVNLPIGAVAEVILGFFEAANQQPAKPAA